MSKASSAKLGGMFADLEIDSTLGIGQLVRLGVDETLTARALMSQRDQWPVDDVWIDDSVASESMTADATGIED